ncbi:diphosphate--fructose-6-phosphate 1-phosphotransferase [Salvia divinorum]|uniref:Diphosphate--fructose-6-phosphate 1-phosphotransferase n=1 Tax=Salvia divinorum TaxID=28513 RepID=A0ABD1HU93_SALDI
MSFHFTSFILLQVAAKKQTLKNVTDYIADVICKRAKLGYNYGVILIPEGLIDFIPEVQQLISELNEILAHDIAKIETEKMLIQMVETELEVKKLASAYKGQFKGQSYFFGYEGRCGLPYNFDATYCNALGYAAGVLLHSGETGLISSRIYLRISSQCFHFCFFVGLHVGNLAAPVAEWAVGGTALTSLMDVERRHGAPFKKYVSMREEWALNNLYINPGPIQFVGQQLIK